MSLRDSIVSQCAPVIVPVKFGDTDAFVRTIRADELGSLQAFKDNEESQRVFAARLLVLTLCDEQGNRILTDEDIETLRSTPYPRMLPAFKAACEINGLQKEAHEKN